MKEIVFIVLIERIGIFKGLTLDLMNLLNYFFNIIQKDWLTDFFFPLPLIDRLIYQRKECSRLSSYFARDMGIAATFTIKCYLALMSQ